MLNLLSDPIVQLSREERLNELRESINTKMKASYLKNQKAYNMRARPRSFDVGDVVFRRNFVQSNLLDHFNAKLAPVGIKAVIKRKIGGSYNEIQDFNNKYTSIYHAKDLWK